MKSLSIRQTGPALLLVPVLLVVIAFSLIGNWQASRISNSLADQVLLQTADRVELAVRAYLKNGFLATSHAALQIEDGQLPAEDLRQWRPELREYLLSFPQLNSLGFGTPSGETTWVIRYPGEAGLEYAIQDDRTGRELVEYSITEDGGLGEQVGAYEFDPRTRPWYRIAVEVGEAAWSEPYTWARGNGGATTLGIALARPVRDADDKLLGVVSADISLLDVSRFLRQTRVFETGQAFLIDSEGRLIATSGEESVLNDQGERREARDLSDPHIAEIMTAFKTLGNEDQLFSTRDDEFRVELAPLTGLTGLDWTLVVMVPNEEILSGVSAMKRRAWWLGLLIVLATLAFGIWMAMKLVRPVTELANSVRRMGTGNLDETIEIHGPVEFEQLSFELNRMASALRDRLRLRQSLSLAMEIQQKLLPAKTPEVPGLQLAGHSTYCDETGGDYYDFIEVDETDSHEMIVVLGDVMGHGIAAALLMATARGILRSRSGEENSLGPWLTHINRLLVEDTGGERFMTMVLLVVNPVTRQVRMACAGHDQPLILHPNDDGFFEPDDFGGLPLGLVEHEEYVEEKLTGFTNGSLLLVGTDGLWESENEAGEPYGKERIRNVMRAHSSEAADSIASHITTDLNRFRGDAKQDDDITFVLLKFVNP